MTTAQTTNLKDGPRPVKSQGGDAPASLGSNKQGRLRPTGRSSGAEHTGGGVNVGQS